MISLYKDSSYEVIDSRSRHYPLITRELNKHDNKLPFLLGVLRRDGESEFIFGPNGYAQIKKKSFYCIDFFRGDSPNRFTYFATIGKDEQSLMKEAHLACFDPQQEVARVRFVLDCLSSKKQDLADYWMPKLLDERITEKNERLLCQLLEELTKNSSNILCIEDLVHHIFRIRPNPCQEKASYFMWLADTFAQGTRVAQNTEKAVRYYQYAIAANPNGQEVNRCGCELFHLGITADPTLKTALDNYFSSLSFSEKIEHIKKCLDRNAEGIPLLMDKLLVEPVKTKIGKFSKVLNALKKHPSHVHSIERLVHHVYHKDSKFIVEKARFFVLLGEYFTASGDILKAERYYRRAKELDRFNPAACIGLALLCYSGQLSGAPDIASSRTLFEEAKAIDHNSPVVHRHLAKIYMESAAGVEDLVLAQQSLEDFLDLEPEDCWALKALESIRYEIDATIEVNGKNGLGSLGALAAIGDALSALGELELGCNEFPTIKTSKQALLSTSL